MNDLDLLRLAGRGYCCAQILVLLALGRLGRENPELVRAAQGLCSGLAGGGETCGALSGAALVLGMYAGRGTDGEEAHERLPLMLDELSEWFRESACAGRGTRCQDILDGPGSRPRGPDMLICGGLVEAAWGKILELLAEAEIDPDFPREFP